MSTDLSDVYGYRSPGGILVGIPGAQIFAVPADPLVTVSYAGTWRPLNGLNPNVFSGGPLRYGVVIVTDPTGAWSVTLPSSTTEVSPAAPALVWNLIFPDGSILSGTVPDVAGPLDLKTLVLTYGWRWASKIYVAPVTPGTLARGTATFAGGAATAAIIFAAPFADSTYGIKLTPSADLGDGTIPRVAWMNKSKTGFTITTDTGAFSGYVDWEAAL